MGSKKRGVIQKPTKVPYQLEQLWKNNYFAKPKTLADVRDQLQKRGFTPEDSALTQGLLRANFLTYLGISGRHKYAQKYPPINDNPHNIVELPIPKETILKLGSKFRVEINDLRLNYGKSGTCTAFLLRKILEKLLIIVFKKNGMHKLLYDTDKRYYKLSILLVNATKINPNGSQILNQKTMDNIKGIKYLADTAAHNPTINVGMETIIHNITYIVIAYQELSEQL